MVLVIPVHYDICHVEITKERRLHQEHFGAFLIHSSFTLHSNAQILLLRVLLPWNKGTVPGNALKTWQTTTYTVSTGYIRNMSNFLKPWGEQDYVKIQITRASCAKHEQLLQSTWSGRCRVSNCLLWRISCWNGKEPIRTKQSLRWRTVEDTPTANTDPS